MMFRSYSNLSKYFLRDYVTMAMVVIVVAITISSHIVSSLRAMKT